MQIAGYITYLFEISNILIFIDEKRDFESKYQSTICDAKSDDPDDILTLTKRLELEKEEMLEKHKDQIKQFDTNLVLQMDQKVIDQQVRFINGFKFANLSIKLFEF